MKDLQRTDLGQDGLVELFDREWIEVVLLWGEVVVWC